MIPAVLTGNFSPTLLNPRVNSLRVSNETNSVVWGILAAPYTGTAGYAVAIKVADVKLLETGGAKVVPIDYRQSEPDLITSIKDLDGIYISGDSESILEVKNYIETVCSVIRYARSVNISGGYFPVVAV